MICVPRMPNELQKHKCVSLYSKAKNFYELGKIITLWLKIVAHRNRSVHVHEINVYIFLLLAEFKLLLPAIDFDCRTGLTALPGR